MWCYHSSNIRHHIIHIILLILVYYLQFDGSNRSRQLLKFDWKWGRQKWSWWYIGLETQGWVVSHGSKYPLLLLALCLKKRSSTKCFYLFMIFSVIRPDTDKLKSKAKCYISCADLASLCIPFLDVGKGNKLNLTM